MFHTVLVYYQYGSHTPSYVTVSSKIFREHPSQLKLGTWKASSLVLKALASMSFSIDVMLTQKDKFYKEATLS